MTITDKLEGLLPADGNYTTKDERVIAEAVKELRANEADQDNWRGEISRWRAVAAGERRTKVSDCVLSAALAFATGCIASAIFVVLV